MSRRKNTPRGLDLALQGGGSHGAFTWGALDALLADGRFHIEGVSGTSAGAMNAAVMASGFANGAAQGARDALQRFWAAVGGVSGCWGAVPASGESWEFNRGLWPGMALWENWLRQWSPYQFNPLNLDPLREILEAQLDVDALRRGPIQLFITATSVRTGQPRVFSGDELTIDALLASACLPQQAQTIVIDGEPFWDGGFSGNPAIWPLIYGTSSQDVLLVQINPRVHEGVPRTAVEITDRVNELTFNASLVAELRAIAFVQKLVREERLDPARYKDLRLHRIADEPGLQPFDASSKLNTDPRLLRRLFDLGHAAAQTWLRGDADSVGKASSMDAASVFLQQRRT